MNRTTMDFPNGKPSLYHSDHSSVLSNSELCSNLNMDTALHSPVGHRGLASSQFEIDNVINSPIAQPQSPEISNFDVESAIKSADSPQASIHTFDNESSHGYLNALMDTTNPLDHSNSDRIGMSLEHHHEADHLSENDHVIVDMSILHHDHASAHSGTDPPESFPIASVNQSNQVMHSLQSPWLPPPPLLARQSIQYLPSDRSYQSSKDEIDDYDDNDSLYHPDFDQDDLDISLPEVSDGLTVEPVDDVAYNVKEDGDEVPAGGNGEVMSNIRNADHCDQPNNDQPNNDADDGVDPPNGNMLKWHEEFLKDPNCQFPDGPQTPDEPLDPALLANAKLLSILQKSNAPLDMHDKIVNWAREFFPEAEKLLSRKQALNVFQKRYNFPSLKPEEVPTYLPYSKKTVTVIRNDIEACLYSFLTNPVLMQSKNLLFDPNDPLANNDTAADYESIQETDYDEDDFYPSDGLIGYNSDQGDINTGLCFKTTLKRYKNGRNMFIGVIFFIDGLPVDMHGHLGLEPVMMTLACFTKETRRRPEAWIPLGYLRNLSGTKLSQEEENSDMAVRQDRLQAGKFGRLQDYHAMLSTILEPLSKIQKSGLTWDWKHSGFAGCRANLRLDVLMVQGDTIGLDKLSCLKGKRCRYCDCKFDDFDHPDHKITYTKMSKVEEWAKSPHRHSKTKRGDPTWFHPLVRNGFFGLRFCNRKYGLLGCSPAELLHCKHKGWDWTTNICFVNLKVCCFYATMFLTMFLSI